MSSSSIDRRVEALEALGVATDRGVAGLVHGRGQNQDPGDQDHIDQQVAELHAAGYSVVYVANLASRPRRNLPGFQASDSATGVLG